MTIPGQLVDRKGGPMKFSGVTMKILMVTIAIFFGAIFPRLPDKARAALEHQFEPQAMEILKKVEKSYKNTKYYKDKGKIRTSTTSRLDGSVNKDSVECSMEKYDNKFLIKSHMSTIMYNGKQIVVSGPQVTSKDNKLVFSDHIRLYWSERSPLFRFEDFENRSQCGLLGIQSLTKPCWSHNIPLSLLSELMLGETPIKTITSRVKNVRHEVDEVEARKHRTVVLLDFAEGADVKLYINDSTFLIEQMSFLCDQATVEKEMPFVSKIQFYEWTSESTTTIKPDDVESQFNFIAGNDDLYVELLQDFQTIKDDN